MFLPFQVFFKDAYECIQEGCLHGFVLLFHGGSLKKTLFDLGFFSLYLTPLNELTLILFIF